MDCTQKPFRKRSRASKKTPPTILNANPTNFRALVQQFTGFPSRSISSGGQKGPVNLNFQLGKVQDHLDSSAMIAPSARSYYQYHQPISHGLQQQPLQVQRCQQQLYQEQQCQLASVSQGSVAATSGSSHSYFPTFGDYVTYALEMPVNDGFLRDDFPLHQLAGESSPGSIVNEGCFQPDDHLDGW